MLLGEKILFYTPEFLATMGLIFILTLNIVLGFLVFLKQPGNRVHQIFLGMSASLTAWSVAVLILNEDKTALAARMTFFTGVFIGWFVLFFTHYFPKKQLVPIHTRWIHHALGATLLLLSISHLIIEDIKPLPIGFEGMHGPFFAPFIILLGYLFFRGFFNLWQGHKKADYAGKTQILIFLTGWLLTVILAFISNLILPLLGIFGGVKIGPLFTFIIIVLTAYSITKYKMLNIKIVATGIFIAALLVAVFTDIFSSKSYYEYVFRGILFVFVLILSMLLNKSVHNEVHRREEMERLKNELETAYAKLKELDQAKTDFLSMASHQLRSPLTVVRLGLGALMDGTFGELKDKRQMEAAQKMLESATRLINLIGDYLNVSRIELGKMQYNFQEQDICALVRAIVDEYQPRAKEKGLKLKFVGAHNPPQPPLNLRGGESGEEGEKGVGIPKIKFDEEKMRHVIVNIVDNAIKYTMKGGIEVGCEVVHNPPQPPLNLRGGDGGGELNLRGGESGKWVKVSFKDTGLGLDKEDIAVLFQKFRRAGSGVLRRRDSEPIEGSGLGLHVAKMFVEKHGGRIWAESDGRGKGSTFFFTLPLGGPPPLPPEEIGTGGKGVELPR